MVIIQILRSLWGLAGYLPHDVDIDLIPTFIEQVKQTKKLSIAQAKKTLISIGMPIWYSIIPFLSLHENGMTITALDADRNMLYRQTYYSIGGGFIVDEAHFGQEEENPVTVPYSYQHAEDILKHCQESGLMLSTVMMKMN